MHRRRFLIGSGAALAATPQLVRASNASPRIAIVFPDGSESAIRARPIIDSFLDEMLRQGFEEGGNLTLSVVSGRDRPADYPEMVRAVVTRGPDLILSYGAPLSRLFKAATSKIPILAVVGDPVLSGLFVDPPPGPGNITGVDLSIGDNFYAKRLEMLGAAGARFIKPAFLTVGVADPRRRFDELRRRWKDAVFAPLTDQVSTESLRVAFRVMMDEGADAMLVGSSIQLDFQAAEVTALAKEHRLPAIYPNRFFVRFGGLMSCGVNFSEMGHALAKAADLILKGAAAGEIPFQRWSRLETAMNLKTARALNINLAADKVARADFVID
jgi:putative ABC transport system substrate-binding protein